MPNKISNAYINPDFSMGPPEKEELKPSKKMKAHKYHAKVDRMFKEGAKDLHAPIKPDRPIAGKIKKGGRVSDDVKMHQVVKIGKSTETEIDRLSSGLSNLTVSSRNESLHPVISQSMDLREDPVLQNLESSSEAQSMDESEDINRLVYELMDLEDDKVPKNSHLQRMIDDLAGFDPSKLSEADEFHKNDKSRPTGTDWKSTWKGFEQISSFLSSMDSKIQFVETPDYEMTDADIEMIPADEIISDIEMESVEEDESPSVKRPGVDTIEENKRHKPDLSPFPSPSDAIIHLPRAPSNDSIAVPPTVTSSPSPSPSAQPLSPISIIKGRNQQILTPPGAVPLIGFSSTQGIQQARHLMHAKRYDAAIVLLSKIYSGSNQKMDVLELMADCFSRTNRVATAIELLQKVAHTEKKNLRVKEKIADCLTKQRQYLKANLIYTAIGQKLGVMHAASIRAKINKNNELLKALEVWPSFNELISTVGIDRGNELTTSQLTAITAFQREVNPRAYLMWDIEMNKLKRSTMSAMEADPTVKKYPVYLPDGSTLTDSNGNPIHLYKSPQLALLTHFTKPSLAMKILETEHEDKLKPPGEINPFAFWNCQYKVCCSMVKQGSQSFYSVNNTAAVGFAVHDPDPLSNLLHTWGEDCYTPTYFNAPGVVAATGQSGADKALRYNEFMHRFQPLTSYVYSVFQQADRIQQQREVRNQFLVLQKDISSRLTRFNLPKMDALFNVLTSVFPKLDPAKQRLGPVVSQIEEVIRGSDIGSVEVQDEIIQKLNTLKDLLQNEGESLRSKTVGESIKKLHEEMTKTVSVREGDAATRPARYKDPQLKKPLIGLYIEETKTIVQDLLRNGMNESKLFHSLFRRVPHPGETILDVLTDMDRSLETLYENNKSILYKIADRAPRHNHIWTRTLTPNELVGSVIEGKYSEIGVRGHSASDMVNANHVSFAGIVLEEGMTIFPSNNGDGYIIQPVRSSSWLGENVGSKTIIDIIKKAHAEGLPSFVLGPVSDS